jgi:diguanylate cyclase (GGDEF)-like protein
VLFLDLDDFKVVNDSLGRLAGDRLLAHFGTQLTGTQLTGTQRARVGGDEFAVLLRAPPRPTPARSASGWLTGLSTAHQGHAPAGHQEAR